MEYSTIRDLTLLFQMMLMRHMDWLRTWSRAVRRSIYWRLWLTLSLARNMEPWVLCHIAIVKLYTQADTVLADWMCFCLVWIYSMKTWSWPSSTSSWLVARAASVVGDAVYSWWRILNEVFVNCRHHSRPPVYGFMFLSPATVWRCLGVPQFHQGMLLELGV